MSDHASAVIRPGLHRIVGLSCPDCGGEIQIERCGFGEFRWETFCAKCLVCDADGWPTLAEAIHNAPEFLNDEWGNADD